MIAPPALSGERRTGDFDDYDDVCYTLRVEPAASYIPACANVLRDVPLALQDIMELRCSSAPNSCSLSAWLGVSAMQVRGATVGYKVAETTADEKTREPVKGRRRPTLKRVYARYE